MKVFLKSRLTDFTPGELPKLLEQLDQVALAINANADALAANPYAAFEDVSLTTPATPNQEFEVVLKRLNKTPAGYTVLRRSAPCEIYDGQTAWNHNRLYLRCTAASAQLTLRIT